MAYDPPSKNDTNTTWQFVIRISTAKPSLKGNPSLFGIFIAPPTSLPLPRPSSPSHPLNQLRDNFFAVVLNMPSKGPITPQMKAALLECFLSATRLLPLQLRSSFILVGGAASVFHGSLFYTEDVDVAASTEATLCLREAIGGGTTQFTIAGGPLQTIEFHCSQGFPVRLELLQLGGGFVDSIAVYEPFYDGFIASRADLLALRGVTVADRGDDGDFWDFEYLLRTAAEEGSLLPQMDEWMLEALKEAVGKMKWVDSLVLSGMLREDNFVQWHSL